MFTIYYYNHLAWALNLNLFLGEMPFHESNKKKAHLLSTSLDRTIISQLNTGHSPRHYNFR